MLFETVAAGLILAAVSGITYLAYKHPQGYRRIFFPLIALIILVQAAITIWYAGVWLTYAKLLRVVESSKWSEAEALAGSMTPRLWVVSITAIAASFYLGVLGILPILLHEKKETEPDDKGPEEKD